MKKVESKTTYRTADGREFTDAKAAKKHEELTESKRNYEEAKHHLGKLLAETYKTADGEPFQIGLLRDYYYVTRGIFSLPVMHDVSFWGTNWSFQDDYQEETPLVLWSWKSDSGSQLEHPREYPISELYSWKENAEKALLVARRKWLAEQLEQVETDEAKRKR